MLATTGTVTKNTDYHICITQAEIEVDNAQYLYDNFVGFHWVLVYGDCVEELKKIAEVLGLDLKLAPDGKES